MFDSPIIGKVGVPTDTPLTGNAEIAFRPLTLSLAAHDGPRAEGKIWVKGRVAQREFLGEFVRYRIDVQGAHIVADQSHFGGNVEFIPGGEVSVGIEPAQMRLLPA